ncbi:MAG: hydrogenase 4 subunit B [Thermoleophilia bacterium]
MSGWLTSPDFFVAGLGVFLAGATGSLLLGGYDRAANWWGNGLAGIGAAMGVVFSGMALAQATPPAVSVATSLPLVSLSLRFDNLSAGFMLLVCLIALVSSIYATGYVRHYYGRYSIGALGFFYNIFIASMILVVTAHNALFFLIAWELMSLASYFLVIYERRQAASITAGSRYFIMTHAGTAFIVFAFLLMYRVTGSFEFETIRAGIGAASPAVRNAIFIAALIGFGVKAGVIPLHIWLPGAHPAAPSHVSALMSGVMIKTGIYMMIRIYLDIMPDVQEWWGLLILVLGAVSSLLGVLYALSEHDLKRLLAYHSIENIGIILLGLGSAMVFASLQMKAAAALSLAAALYHTLNHAIFKALLFLGAGPVISQTHTRNIEKYGGLIRLMPQTALFFLIGSMAISALPPFNGFFSEWLTFQGLFQGIAATDILTKGVFILASASLAFTGGLAAACFVKAFGMTFLARPRSDAAAKAGEPALTLRLAMGSLALLTLLLGIFSGIVVRLLTRVTGAMSGIGATDSTDYKLALVRSPLGEISMPAIFIGIVSATTITVAMVFLVSRKQKIRTGPTWDCGGRLTPRMEITATGFSRSIITVSRRLLRPSHQTDIEYHDKKMGYFPRTGTVTLGRYDIYMPLIYKPLRALVTLMADNVKKIQSGNINAYIFYIFFVLIGLLLFIDY